MNLGKIFSMFLTAAVLCLIFSPSDSLAKGQSEKNLTVKVDFNDEDGMLYGQRVMQIFAEITNNSSDTISMKIEWEIVTDDWRPLMKIKLPFETLPGQTRNAYCPWFELPGPGFYRYTAIVTTKTGDSYAADKVVGVDPELIANEVEAEADFDAFWTKSLDALKAINPDFKITKQKRDKKTKTKLYKVEMKSWDGITVRGWLEVPKKRGKYPALLRVPGYNGNQKPIDKYDDLIVFSFNPRSHGESDNGPEPDTDMWLRGLDSEQTYYYRGAYLDCIRAVDFLASRKDVDQDRIAVWGGSQGGGFSFATAALDDRIDLCISDIPWLCDWDNYFAITHWPEIGDWLKEHPEQNWNSMLKSLSYFDTKNMAASIDCPVMMNVSLQDPVCPPKTSFATYNLINSPKEYRIHTYSGHWQPKSHYDKMFVWLRSKFKMD